MTVSGAGPAGTGNAAPEAAARAPAEAAPPSGTQRDDPRPRPPEEPDPADCCGEGCVRCIYDVHDEAVERYRAALAAWQERHPEKRPG